MVMNASHSSSSSRFSAVALLKVTVMIMTVTMIALQCPTVD
eukprot:CAMPEP_0119549878 /NCGR_PEP_ID=MMETSP1352-20130426/3508_1 /TAXON_ID=265584 /ORGANISM="Stauroneis constricta, Strain CCMP1120" /LENGTH=40 /DNA_ID= /DNA_START= /DNA_END= /DNA_ORIENTATION=